MEKIRKQLVDVRRSIHRESYDISHFKFHEGDIEGAHRVDFDDKTWTDFQTGGIWGGYDVTAWFRAKVCIPAHFKDKKVHLRFLAGPRDGGGSTAECLLYVNGKPLQGIDVWHEEAYLPPQMMEDDSIAIAIKAWSGVLDVPDRRRFKEAKIIWIDEEAEKFYYLADTILKSVELMDKNDLKGITLLKTLDNAYNMIDFLEFRSDEYYESLERAYDYLNGEIEGLKGTDILKPTIVALGHSHIDMAWLWRLKDTREKASRTFSTVLHLMDQYPEYRYIHSSPQLYKFLKEDYPEIFKKVRERIIGGEWEITGGMWVESDTNIPSGESLVRQFLFGRRFIKEEFGQDTNVVWLPDVFGYSGSLPQIMKKSGMKYFLTSKISWNQYNRFPYDTFMWKGIDGSQVLTYFITTPEGGDWQYTYNGSMEPNEIKGAWENYQQKDLNHELLYVFGWGDGGGGPTTEMLECARAMEDLPGMPKVEIGKAEDFFTRLDDRIEDKDIPIWDGELYLELHRGTYTSQAFIKRANRKSEALYHCAELFSSLACILNCQDIYPKSDLNRGWEKILLNQFHDILPGSSIRQVYEDCIEDYREIEALGQRALASAKDSISSSIGTDGESVVVYNPTSMLRDDIVAIPWFTDAERKQFVDIDGSLMPKQIIEAKGQRQILTYVENVPSLGYKVLRIIDEANCPHSGETLKISKNLMQNKYYKIQLNSKGQIVSLYDRISHRDIVTRGERANVFQVFEDRPINFDAWDIDEFYKYKMREIQELIEIEVEEEGPIRGVLRLKWRFYDSIIEQRITIYSESPRIDFKTNIDWQQRQVLLKVAFPVDIRSTRATYDIQFGSIERPTHSNTSWDMAKFEVVGHKWADLSEGNYGVALLNDCKYGYDVRDNVIRLTLLKSPTYPDDRADQGQHVFTYSLLPHADSLQRSNVIEQSYWLNYPMTTSYIDTAQEGMLPLKAGFAYTNTDHVIIETVKQAEEENAWIIRLYECKRYTNDHVKLIFHKPIEKAVECNLMEEEDVEIDYEKNHMDFSIRPFEIKTFKVWM